MSVFAVPRSIARSREKSLYIPLNMERLEPSGARGATPIKAGSDATLADERLCPGSALESKGLIGQPAAGGAGWSARTGALTTRSRPCVLARRNRRRRPSRVRLPVGLARAELHRRTVSSR